MIVTIVFYGRLIITCSQDFIGHCMPTRMHPEGTFMNFFYDLILFVFIHVSEQNRVIVSLVQNTSIEEKLACMLPQSLLISDRSILWIFFRFKIPFDIIKPRFLISFFFYLIIERWLIQPQDSDRGELYCPT